MGGSGKSMTHEVAQNVEEILKEYGNDRIREYLLQFTELLDMIPKAVEAAKKHFPEAQLTMDVYQDPEIDDCYLVLYVRSKYYDDSFIERLEKAEAEFLNQLVNKAGWIQLTTDFQEPGVEIVSGQSHIKP
jgi:hypothetical protein